MEQILITMEEVSQTAVMIRNENQSLEMCLQNIRVQIDQLSSYWQSLTADTVRNRFYALLPAFESYKTIVDSYAMFLDHTVVSYQETEAMLNMHADQF